MKRSKKGTIRKVDPRKLINEALEYIIKWTSTNLDYYKREEESNWMLAYDRTKDYWHAIPLVEGCKASTFGSTEHVESLYNIEK